MSWTPTDILAVLDRCCDDFSFPMLDNGYVYLAATRMSGYRSDEDWALVIEVFGYSPRTGMPDTCIHCFGSRLERPASSPNFASDTARLAYLTQHRHDESVFIFPITGDQWMDAEDCELVASEPAPVILRERAVLLPALAEYATCGIVLEDPRRVRVYEACRWLAAHHRDGVLATAQERRTAVPSGLNQVFQFEEWRHPDLLNEERPSSNPSFRALAEILAGRRDASALPDELPPNTHWKHWPDGGTL